MSLFIGVEIKNEETYKIIEQLFKDNGIKLAEEERQENDSCIYAMGYKRKYLVDIADFSDEELEDEYRSRDI